MSLVDRWLARALADQGAATSATSATSPKKASITAALEVASRVRRPATSAQATTGSPGVSQPVADTLRREKPQNSSAINDMSQLSQMSQVVMSASDEDEPAAIVEHDGGSPREVECTPSQPTLLAPGLWFDRFGLPGEPAFDEPCVPRRGRVERQGRLFLHFCVTCGAWGAFGYGVTTDCPGRWYCREHRPKDEM